MKLKTKILIALIGIAFMDMIVPIPFLGILLVYVTLSQPPWFREMVDQVYGGVPGPPDA